MTEQGEETRSVYHEWMPACAARGSVKMFDKKYPFIWLKIGGIDSHKIK